MQINTLSPNNIFINTDKNITVSGINHTYKLNDSQQNDNQSIAVKMEISKKGRELSAQYQNQVKETAFDGELLPEEKITIRQNDDDISAKIDAVKLKLDDISAKKGSISEDGKDILQEIEEQKERDYSEFVVQKNIVEEMQTDATEAVMQADQKQNDVEVMIRSLGEESGWTYEKKEDNTTLNDNHSGQLMRDGSLYGDLTSPESAVDFAKRQSEHVKNEAFEADQRIHDTIALSEKRIEQHKENILSYQKEINRIIDEDKEIVEKGMLSKEDYVLYKTGKNKEIGGFSKLIAEEKDGMYEEIRTKNAINRANVGNQNMVNASKQADNLTTAANDEFMRRTMQEALKKADDEPELKFDIDKKQEIEQQKELREEQDGYKNIK